MVDLLALLLDFLDVVLDFYLFLPALESVGVEELAVESAHLLGVLEELGVGLGQFLLFEFLLELALFLVHPPSLQFLLLELLVALFLLALLEVLQVVTPLVSPLLAFLI